MKKRGLGRSFDALLGSAATPTLSEELLLLPLSQVVAGKSQPRKHFDNLGLQELAHSIDKQGLIQPIVVREIGADRYEILAGERRFRACQSLGWKDIPAIVRTSTDREALALALVENLQRSDLNPLEEAEAFKRLIEECQLTHEQCAQEVGKSRASISNSLRLLDLSPFCQSCLKQGLISTGHAKVLLGQAKADSWAHRVIDDGLSVRQLEQLIKAAQTPTATRQTPTAWETSLSLKFGLPVKRQGDDNTGKVVISYRNPQELKLLLKQLAP
jgi:ParB family chromosome partitioning protein